MDPFSPLALGGGVAASLMYDLLKSVAFGLRNKARGTAEELSLREAYAYACEQEDPQLVDRFFHDAKITAYCTKDGR